MSLMCVETDNDIEYGTSLYAGTRDSSRVITALSEKALQRVPERCKQRSSRPATTPGVDIHEASSTLNFTGSYTICGFRLGRFLFWLSEEDARRYLPRLTAELGRYETRLKSS